MKKLSEIFSLTEFDVEILKTLLSTKEFSVSIICIDLGEGIELDFNSNNLIDSINALHNKLISLETHVLTDDYISFTIYNSDDEKLYKHENKRSNFNSNSILEIIKQPELYPNYLDETTVPWWKNEI